MSKRDAIKAERARITSEQALERTRPGFSVHTVGALLSALASVCKNSGEYVVARTPHGTYTFKIANVHRASGGYVVLDLSEIPGWETE